jgi:diguanylate cyclase (GGDEF)-like protein
VAVADASSQSGARQIGRTLPPLLIAATVIALLVLAWLAWALPPTRLPTRWAWIGATAVVAMAIGIGLGWGLIAAFTRGTGVRSVPQAPIAHRPSEPATEAESVQALRATVAHQAAEITRYQGRLEEVLKELDITSARLQETSFTDELTGLYNRRFLFVRLEEEISRHRRFNHPVSVVLFDLDGFKEVNDRQGHMIGDETLRDISRIVTRHSRGIDVVVRYGGDEFAFLLVETSKAGARLYAERIRQIISTYPYSHDLPVTASFGVASLPEDTATTAVDLIRIADEALYVAKRGGKDQVAGAPAPNRGTPLA